MTVNFNPKKSQYHSLMYNKYLRILKDPVEARKACIKELKLAMGVYNFDNSKIAQNIGSVNNKSLNHLFPPNI